MIITLMTQTHALSTTTAPMGSGSAASLAQKISETVDLLPALPPTDPSDRYNLRALTAVWLLGLKSEHTRRRYFAALNDWLSFCERAGVDPLAARKADIDAWQASMRKLARQPDGTYAPTDEPPSAAFVNQRLAAVSAWYRYLTQNEVTDRNPALLADRPKRKTASPFPALTEAEAGQLLDYLDSRAQRLDTEAAYRDAALIRLMIDTGLRTEAALSARFDNLATEQGHQILRYTRKGGAEDFVPLAPHVLALLVRYWDRRAQREGQSRNELRGWLFASTPHPHQPQHQGGNRLRQRDLQRILRNLARQAGLACADRITPHSLRRTAATVALNSGATLAEVQDLLGHASPETTRRYDAARHKLDSSPVFKIAGAVAQHQRFRWDDEVADAAALQEADAASTGQQVAPLGLR